MKTGISKAVERTDARKKIRGEAEYIADRHFEEQLYAKTIRSSKAKARILEIRLPEMPADYFAVGRNDVPGLNRMRTVVSDHPIFAEEQVEYIGQPLFLLVGPDREKLCDLADMVNIRYEEEAGVFTLEEAEKQDTVFTDYQYRKGDPAAAFRDAAQIIEEEFRTGYQEHAYLEPQGIAAEYRNGILTVYGSMQCPYYVRNALLETMAIPDKQIRIIQTVTGGAFGGKEEFPSLTACQVAVAAKKTEKPVMMIYDRDEDIRCSTKRHPSLIRCRAALDKNNAVTGLEMDVLLNAGAYNGLSPVVLQRALFSATGVYDIPHLRVRGRNYRTNMTPSGAFRGFGAPQSIFAIEMLMLQIAVRLGEDPLEYKMRHALKQGSQTCTGGKVREEVKLPEIVGKIRKMSAYVKKQKNKKPFSGIGASLFLHGCGFTGRGESDIRGKVILSKDKDSVTLRVSSVEMGQGAETVLRKIVAQSLDIPIEKVNYAQVDTGAVPDSGPTVASRTTMIVGGLLQECAKEMKARWRECDRLEIEKVYQHPSWLHWDDSTFQGDAYPVYSWGANIAEVEVDPISYEISVKKIYAVYDVGVPVDLRTLDGQMQGGIAQGIGWATIELMEGEAGRLKQSNLTDYKVPTSMDTPEMEIAYVNNPYPYGPFGAKCAGELPFVGSPPAVAAAVSDALGRKINYIPLTPESLMESDNED
ncbi:MAG: xanthine dehydrogenase family protein molybdopterin-binding subunit [Candidatus Neomarinimicrobiota bacterium]